MRDSFTRLPSDLETVADTSHVSHVVNSCVLKMPKERKQIRVRYFNAAAAECSVATFEDIVGTTAVVAVNTQP